VEFGDAVRATDRNAEAENAGSENEAAGTKNQPLNYRAQRANSPGAQRNQFIQKPPARRASVKPTNLILRRQNGAAGRRREGEWRGSRSGAESDGEVSDEFGFISEAGQFRATQ